MSLQSILVIVAVIGLIAGLIWNNKPDKKKPDIPFKPERQYDDEADDRTVKHCRGIDKLHMYRQNYENREE